MAKKIIKILKGSSVPTFEGKAMSPTSLKVPVGTEVEFVNEDTAAHTITSGTPKEGPSGIFDSSLIMSKATFGFNCPEKGKIPYFDMVHPWITAEIIVE